MLFSYSFIHSLNIFCASLLLLMICLTCLNFARETWWHEVAKILRGFVFVLFWNLVFMRKSSQPRIYADLLRFQCKGPHPHNNTNEVYNSTFHSFFSCSYTCLWTRKIKECVIYMIKTMNIFCLPLHAFFYISNTFVSNARLKLAKN